MEGPGRVVADSWRFIPLCADTAGGWDDAAIDTLQKCAAYVDKARRGHVVGLWWQMLSVALQSEHERVLRNKVAACAGQPFSAELVSEFDDIFSLDTAPPGIF